MESVQTRARSMGLPNFGMTGIPLEVAAKGRGAEVRSRESSYVQQIIMKLNFDCNLFCRPLPLCQELENALPEGGCGDQAFRMQVSRRPNRRTSFPASTAMP